MQTVCPKDLIAVIALFRFRMIQSGGGGILAPRLESEIHCPCGIHRVLIQEMDEAGVPVSQRRK